MARAGDALDEIVLAEEREHIMHGIIRGRLLGVVLRVVWRQDEIEQHSPPRRLVVIQEPRLVHQNRRDEDARLPAPDVQVRVDMLLGHLVEQPALLHAKQQVVDPALGRPRIERGTFS